MAREHNRYFQIIEMVFAKRFRDKAAEVAFERRDLVEAAEKLRLQLPKNLGDVLYSFRYRADLPESIIRKAPKGYTWIIRPAGRARYKFVLTAQAAIVASETLVETKILDATPGVIAKYALTDEQALLAKLRYNRLIDVFTGLVCYSLQSHLRTTVPGLGQVETDEIYIGIDKRGVQYAVPVQAKGGSGKIGIVQIEQDLALCAAKFPGLVCRPIAATLMKNDVIALFELEETKEGVRISSEKHYSLVPPDSLSPEELKGYQRRPL
jgi:hypothetical protein